MYSVNTQMGTNLYAIFTCTKDANTMYSVNTQMGTNLYAIFTCAKDANTMYYAW